MRNCSRIWIGVLAVSSSLFLFSIDAKAAGTVTSVLPSGGVNLALAKASPISEIQTSKISANAKIEPQVSLSDIPDAKEIEKKVAEEEFYKNLVIAQVKDYVNVRDTASEKGEIVGKLYNKSVGKFLGEEDGWYQIQSGNVTGYVKAEYCVTGRDAIALAKEVGTEFATVTATGLYVRKEPDMEAKIITMVPEGDDFVVVEKEDEWIKINMEEGDGWVSAEYVELRTEFVQAESKEEEKARLAAEEAARKKAREAAAKSQQKQNNTATVTYAVGEGSELGVAVANYGLQFVGNPYVYGGSSLTNGTDCSGFVMSVYANFGVSLPHSSKADRTQGTAVDGLENAQPGDIICYSGHVAIYIGNGQIVHASNAKTGIIVSNADYKKVLAVRRIF
ncbi:MAG: SH3 domain-containing protein [Lachnospiraceae bacterium]